MRSCRIATILESAEQLSEPIRVSGATPSARAFLMAQFVMRTQKPVLILCPNNELASEFASDLECLSAQAVGMSLRTCFVPTWEQSPYSPVAPSIKTRLARTAALSGLLSAQPPRVIITSLPAACQATAPRALFLESIIRIKADETSLSRETLLSRLVEIGYLRTDPVEDPGTFAARGEIVDIFPPDRPHPLRIEFFDDVVEKIREFDPATQRAAKEDTGLLREAAVPPAREVLINSSTAARVRENIKKRADDLGIKRTVRDPILASVQAGIFPDHSDAWAPFTYPDSSRLWDYLPPETILVWNDELSCQQEWDSFFEEQKKLAADLARTEVIVPEVNQLFDRSGQPQGRLYLDQIALADLATIDREEEEAGGVEPSISPNLRAITSGNSNLARGSRSSLGDLESKFKLWIKQGFRILALASTQGQLERMRFLMEERGFTCHSDIPPRPSTISLQVGTLSEGFRWPAEGLVVLADGEVLGGARSKRVKRVRQASTSASGSAAKDWSGLAALSDLSVGDAVVHLDHGIGRYQGLVRLALSGAPSDFLLLEYANKDKLYLPVYRLNVIQKYVGSGEGVSLDRLGSQAFAKTKEKVREGVRKLAINLVQLYAERKIRPGVQFSPPDASFREFEAKFPFDETPDQLKSIEDILHDMESGRPMDRLVCGDVGYGKTEVAIRAAFRAVSDGKQVAVLVPTTVLAYQHEQNFRTRMKDYPIAIESVSRFKSPKEQKAALETLASGRLDIVIGTHRLLSKDVKFRDLGLVIVDEEHRFGVEHKERLKALKVNTHVLTLTATPIPRTLHMALAGLRDISLINTPPVDRLPIRTYVSKFDESLIQRAITFELNRGGQVFFVHNRVQSIYELASRLQELIPKAKIGVGHGQMAEGQLEEAMFNFYQKRTNVLVCTTIIESGLDLPTANTIIINRADSLGLAQLYQIRGRVGRGDQRAYAYLLIPAETAVTDEAKKRLEVIQRFVELGSGFSIANHDLELRGGGDLLGAQQSGHIAAVGFDLYTELLEEAIREIEGKPLALEESRREPEIKAPFPSFLAEEYVPDVHQRLSLYRRFSAAENDEALDRLEEELRDRFGPLPGEAQNLFWMIRIKQLLKRAGMDSLTAGPERVSLVPGPSSNLDPVRAIALVSGNREKYQITPDKVIAKIPTASLRDLYFALEDLLGKLSCAPKKV